MSGALPDRIARMSCAFTSSSRITSYSTLISGYSELNIANRSSGIKFSRPNQTLTDRSSALAGIARNPNAMVPDKMAPDSAIPKNFLMPICISSCQSQFHDAVCNIPNGSATRCCVPVAQWRHGSSFELSVAGWPIDTPSSRAATPGRSRLDMVTRRLDATAASNARQPAVLSSEKPDPDYTQSSGECASFLGARASSPPWGNRGPSGVLITHNFHPDSDTMGHRLPGSAGFQPAASSRKRRYEHRWRAGSPRSQEDRGPGKPTGPG